MCDLARHSSYANSLHPWRINIYSDNEDEIQGYRLGEMYSDNSGVLNRNRFSFLHLTHHLHDHATLNFNVTVLALYFLFYYQER